MKSIQKNIITYCNKLLLGSLVAIVIGVPLFFDIRIYSVFDLSKVMALYLLTLTILVLWTLTLTFDYNFKFSHTAIDIPILAYISVFIISTATSINPIMSLFGTYKRFEGLTGTCCYLLVFYAIVNFVTTKNRLYLLILSILAGATISSCYGITQHLGFDFFKWSSFEAWRVFSTFGNPVFFSAYLVMTLPLAVVLFFITSSQQKDSSISKNPSITWIFFAIASLIYTTFWLTNTRACFIALLGGLTPLLFLIFKKQTSERYKLVVLASAFILIGVFFNVQHKTSVIEHFTRDVQTAGSPTKNLISDKNQTRPRPWLANKFPVTGSSFSRIFQYLTAFQIIKDHPILGIGPDTIGILYQQNLAKVFAVQESDNGFQFPRQDRIHNDILDTMVTRGIFGLGTYIWLLIAFGVFVGKNYKRLSNQNKYLILGILAGILCYLIQNEFSFGNTPIVTLFWVMMGLCFSIVKINEAEEGLNTMKGTSMSGVSRKGKKSGYTQPDNYPTSPRHIFYRWLGCGIALSAIGFAAIFIIRVYRADAYFEYGRRIIAYEKENAQTATGKGQYFLRHAELLNTYETFYRDEICKTYIQMAFKTKDEKWIQKAYVEANNILSLIPQHYMGFFHLGMISQFLAENFKKNTADTAIDCYKKAIELDPFQATFYGNLASLYVDKGNLDQAIEELFKAYLLRPDEVSFAAHLANAYLQKGDLENALIFARKTVMLNPTEPAFYNNLGAVLSRKGMHEESINAFKKAVELNPKDPLYLENFTKLCLLLGKYEEAIPYYKKLIDINPSSADYYNNLGVAYKKQKQFDVALQSFQKAISLKSDNPIYTHNLASTFVDKGQFATAEQTLMAFIEKYPNHHYANIHLLLASVYSKNADWEKVASECEQTLKIDEKSITAYKMLGTAYCNMHQFERAEKMLNKALALDANDREAKDLLAEMSNKKKGNL